MPAVRLVAKAVRELFPQSLPELKRSYARICSSRKKPIKFGLGRPFSDGVFLARTQARTAPQMAPLSALRWLKDAAEAAPQAAAQPASRSALAVALALAAPSVLLSCVRVGVRWAWQPCLTSSEPSARWGIAGA